MFFTMINHVEDGTTYQRRFGRMTKSFEVAKKKALERKGFIQDEGGNLVGQAFDPSLPKYVGKLINIGSGEDLYV
jgi:hypothetical protein